MNVNERAIARVTIEVHVVHGVQHYGRYGSESDEYVCIRDAKAVASQTLGHTGVLAVLGEGYFESPDPDGLMVEAVRDALETLHHKQTPQDHCAPDAEFIATTRTAVPALIARIEELEAAIQRVQELHPRVVIAVHEGYGVEAWCPNCQHHYPCSTIQALEAPPSGYTPATEEVHKDFTYQWGGYEGSQSRLETHTEES